MASVFDFIGELANGHISRRSIKNSSTDISLENLADVVTSKKMVLSKIDSNLEFFLTSKVIRKVCSAENGQNKSD